MAQDPKKKKSPKTHTMTAKSGGKIEVTKKSVDDAKAKTNAFKERPAYGGKTTKAGTTSHAGVFTRTTGPVSRRKAAKALAYDKKLHKQDSIKHSGMTKSFATAKPKGTN